MNKCMYQYLPSVGRYEGGETIIGLGPTCCSTTVTAAVMTAERILRQSEVCLKLGKEVK